MNARGQSQWCAGWASGYSREEVAARLAGQGLAGVIQKPFSLDALRETVATLMPARDK